ncbi:MAG: Asp-tRNA(Asn)/Glu-tRNA(Gln) amidotransferase subunit GatC [Pseudomonadota bacterium]
MSVTSDTIREIASLAKLRVEEEEISSLTERFNTVLALFDELQSANVSELAPMANPLDATQPLREDFVTEQNQREAMQEIAPSVSEGHYLVPRVVE